MTLHGIPHVDRRPAPLLGTVGIDD